MEPSPDTFVDAVVDEDGNAVIPAAQLPERLPAGSHVRVRLEPVITGRSSVEGVLPDLPDLSWEDFDTASRLATKEAEEGRQAS